MLNILVFSNKSKSASWSFYSKALIFDSDIIYCEVKTSKDLPDLNKYDIILLFGSNFDISSIRKKNQSLVIGHLEPRAAQKNNLLDYDFLVVNSIESRDYFAKYCENIFVYPTFPIVSPKVESGIKQSRLIIGYHGNKIHLEAMNPRITNALNALSKKVNFELWAMYDINGLGKWKESGLSEVNVRHIQFDTKNYLECISKVDIGIIPQFIPVRNNKFLKWALSSYFGKFNERADNFFFRFKETTNNGRAYVFAQYSIPVVVDMTPSSCVLIGDNEYGFIAYSEDSWYKFLLELAQDKNLRLKMGNNLYKRYLEVASQANLQNSFIDFLLNLADIKNFK
jgi:hypothetical protein